MLVMHTHHKGDCFRCKTEQEFPQWAADVPPCSWDSQNHLKSAHHIQRGGGLCLLPMLIHSRWRGCREHRESTHLQPLPRSVDMCHHHIRHMPCGCTWGSLHAPEPMKTHPVTGSRECGGAGVGPCTPYHIPGGAWQCPRRPKNFTKSASNTGTRESGGSCNILGGGGDATTNPPSIPPPPLDTRAPPPPSSPLLGPQCGAPWWPQEVPTRCLQQPHHSPPPWQPAAGALCTYVK